MKQIFLFYLLMGLLFAVAIGPRASAEVRLLSGSPFNQIHSGGGDIMDISPDGNLVLFYTRSSTSTTSPGFAVTGLYLRNLATGSVDYVGDSTVTHTGVDEAVMSDDGRFIAWSSLEDRHIYLRDRQTGVTTWVTANQQGGVVAYTVRSAHPVISGDGRYLAFASDSRTLITNQNQLPRAGNPGVYLYDRQNNSIKIISLTYNGAQISGLGEIDDFNISNFWNFDMSPDAKYVVFATTYNSSHPDRANKMFANYAAVLRRDITNGNTLLLNKNESDQVSNAHFTYPRISADGNRVAFLGKNVGQLNSPTTTWPKMVSSHPSNPNEDLYVKDIPSKKVWVLTKTITNVPNVSSIGISTVLNLNGSIVAFSSKSPLLTNDDEGTNSDDIFKAVLNSNGTQTLEIVTDAPDKSSSVTFTRGPVMPDNGSYIAFSTSQFAAMGFPGSSSAHAIGVGTFSTPVVNGLTFEQWASVLPADKRGANDNPSGDGVPNLLKYFIGSNALTSDLSHLPEEQFVTGDSLGISGDMNKYMVFKVRIRKVMPAGYTWQVQSASTLEKLISIPGPTLQVGAPESDGDFNIYRYRSFSPLGSTGFMRLKVNIDP
ncbi:hypothetical protein ACFSSA_06280 [Luteolibacter algae]|uniref:WD40 repeat protein n=1 Tax=Luteolibacter algae TaxID=454151 RepID=A0ABW5D5B7_9BACT